VTTPADGGAEEAAAESHTVHTQIMRGTGWSALSTGGGQILSFLAVLIFARLLDPHTLGVMALALTFLAFVQYAQESGLGAALIYQRTDVRRAAASVLLFAPVVGLALSAITIVLAPFAAQVFHTPELTNVLRAMVGLILFRSVAVVPTALLERQMSYRGLAASELVGVAVQVGLSIGLVLAGLELWALVIGYIAGAAAQTMLVWFLTPFVPSPRDADWKLLRQLAGYGRYIGGAHIVNLLNRTLDNLVVARVLGPTRLAYYANAFKIGANPVQMLAMVIGRALFAAYSSVQEEIHEVRKVFVDNLQRTALVVLPIGVGIAVAADPVVRALLGDNWLPSIEPLRFLALFGAVRALAAGTGELWSARGKPHLRLVWELLHAGLVAPVLIVMTLAFGITGTAAGMLIVDLTTGIPAIVMSSRMIGLSLRTVAGALAPTALCVALLALTLAIVDQAIAGLPPVVELLLLIGVGAVVYIGGTVLFARTVVTTMWINLRGARVAR
jgi:PST family polysaccharide transporter